VIVVVLGVFDVALPNSRVFIVVDGIALIRLIPVLTVYPVRLSGRSGADAVLATEFGP
jgi:hypothetical protein